MKQYRKSHSGTLNFLESSCKSVTDYSQTKTIEFSLNSSGDKREMALCVDSTGMWDKSEERGKKERGRYLRARF